MKRLDKLRIAGGTPLHGTIRIQGSKNAALPMMAAALLYPGISVLRNCPRIADVFCMEEILGTLGVDTRWQEHDLYLDCTKVQKTEISAFYRNININIRRVVYKIYFLFSISFFINI